MNLTLPPDVERSLDAAAKTLGVSPETLVLEVLQERLEALAPRKHEDDWEALLRSVGTPTGISLDDEAASRANQYEN